MGSRINIIGKDIATVKEMCALLEPLATATVRLEADAIPTSGMVLPIIIGLEKALKRVQPVYCTSVQTGLINSIKRRLDFVHTDDHYILSAMLEPRFRLKWVRTPAEETTAKSCVIRMNVYSYTKYTDIKWPRSATVP